MALSLSPHTSRRWLPTEIGFCWRFRGHLVAHVQVAMQTGDIFSHFSIVGNRRISKSLGQLQAVFGFRHGVCGSLQPLIFPIEFVDQNQFFGSLHYFTNRLDRIPSTGGSRAVRKPPFCNIRRFCRNDVFFTDSALKSLLRRRSLVF